MTRLTSTSEEEGGNLTTPSHVCVCVCVLVFVVRLQIRVLSLAPHVASEGARTDQVMSPDVNDVIQGRMHRTATRRYVRKTSTERGRRDRDLSSRVLDDNTKVVKKKTLRRQRRSKGSVEPCERKRWRCVS